MRSVALANQKGGVGKTTTAVHLAHGLALRGARVVLADFDPQGNAVVAMQAMTGGSSEGGLRGLREGLWILDACREMSDGPAGLHDVRKRIEAASPDWLIVDCPPRIDEWGRAGLQLCREVIIPVQAEFLAMQGLSQILATIQSQSMGLLGVLPTMVDVGEQVSREVVANLRTNLGSLVLETMILRDAAIVEAASHGVTVFDHDPCTTSAFCYGELIREVCDGRPQAW